MSAVSSTKISLIVAMTRSGVIGRKNALPWNLPADLKRFRQLTTNHSIVMGRKTFESIGRALPNRRNIVISRNAQLKMPTGEALPAGVELVSSLDQALQECRSRGEIEVFVIGGSQIFADSLALADKLYITWIDQEFEGDVRFPDIELKNFNVVQSVSSKDPFDFSFVDYERRS